MQNVKPKFTDLDQIFHLVG